MLDGLYNDADLEVFEYREYGREFMKSCRCSPDVWLQLALQVRPFGWNDIAILSTGSTAGSS